MSSPVATAHAPTRRALSGWGRSPISVADVVTPGTVDDVAPALEAVRRSGGHLVARGLGRSYGDAAQTGGGTVIDMTGCRRILGLDVATSTVRVEGGTSLDELMAWAIPKGYFVPVTPGTRQVTVGGAIAADVHGKNHHRDGSLGGFVRSLRIATPSGVTTCSPELEPGTFWATIGGMGLTGVILDATIALVAIETSRMSVDTDRAENLDECMAVMSASDEHYHYSVAWVDCLSRGKSLGRSVLTRARHATADDFDAAGGDGRSGDPLAYAPRQLLDLPVSAPVRLPQRPLVRAFNEVWFRKAPRHRAGELQGIGAYFHPLDGIGSWNLLYGPRGFLQYQFVVPFGSEDLVRHVIETLGAAQMPSLFAVLKRFGPANEAPLSFPRPGWTLALDVPLGVSGLGEILDGFDDAVADAGGRVYFAKDSRLRSSLVEAMYPRLAEWRAVVDEIDPGRMITSDLSRRLRLRQGAAT